MSERRILHGTKRARAYRRSGSPAACRRPAGTLGRRSSASYSSYTPRVSVLRSCRTVSIQQAAGGTCYAKKMLGDMESKNVPYFSPKPTFAKVFFYLFFRKTPPILPLVFIFGKGSKKKKNAFAKHSDDCNVLRSKHLFKSSALHACQELALTNLLPPPPLHPSPPLSDACASNLYFVGTLSPTRGNELSSRSLRATEGRRVQTASSAQSLLQQHPLPVSAPKRPSASLAGIEVPHFQL